MAKPNDSIDITIKAELVATDNLKEGDDAKFVSGKGEITYHNADRDTLRGMETMWGQGILASNGVKND